MVDKTTERQTYSVHLRNFVPSIASETRIQPDDNLLRNINVPHSFSSVCAHNTENADVP